MIDGDTKSTNIGIGMRFVKASKTVVANDISAMRFDMEEIEGSRC